MSVRLRYSFDVTAPAIKRRLVGLDGLEPSTSRLSGVRSNHLSYRPDTGSDHSRRTAPWTRDTS